MAYDAVAGAAGAMRGAHPALEGAAFFGDRAALERHLVALSGQSYVYVLCRPDRTPFYVGKGVNRRVLAHEAEARQNHPVGETNPFKCNVIRKILRQGGAVLYAIDSAFPREREQACLEREAELIARIGRLHEGGTLTNLAGGVGRAAGASPFSIARHEATLSGVPEDNPERAVLNRFLQGIGPVRSVPVKPVGQIARILPSTPHPSPRRPTQRCAYALIASASAHGLMLEPGVRIPRSFVHEGVEGVIENGVARDILKAGMAELVPAPDPRAELFALSSRHIALIVDLVGAEALVDRGLL
jgi:hypothetical protein